MKVRPALLLAVVVLGAALPWGGRTAALTAFAQPQDSETVALVAGCQLKALTAYAVGTPLRTITDGISGAGANPRMWFQAAGTSAFLLYDPRSEERSLKTVLEAGDEAAFVCVDAAATWSRPTGAVAPPAPTPVSPTGDVRALMEMAVPQVTDLAVTFMSLDEEFERGSAPGPLYAYTISYGDPLALIDYHLEALMLAVFGVDLYETVGDASSGFDLVADITADELRAQIGDPLGGSAGLEIGSLTFQDMDVSDIGDEASWTRVRMQVRPVNTNEMFLPMAMDVIFVRRERVVGSVFAAWTPGPPGSDQQPRRLARIMDENIQAVVPQLIEAVEQ